MHFHFPIIIIDEDFRSENASGLGIRALAEAIEVEGFEVLGVTSYGDLTSFAQQQSRASGFILSIDDEEFGVGEADKTIAELRAFVKEIRCRNEDIPIFLYGETRTSRHIPNDVLRELHGFIHMFEDTPEFIGRYVVREAKTYLKSVPPPFFRALTHYASDGSYSWHCPGHSGGVAFLKSPVGQMFHQFFGENMLRADVCNAVEELGQLLDHTGPVAASERNAARIFNADHLYFVTNGTSTSNKIVWHSTVAPGDIVIVDRNCHKSVLHSIIMTGAVPVFLMPTRNHFGIIGPIPEGRIPLGEHQKKIAAHPFARDVKAKPRVLTITQSTYDGILYNVEEIKEMLDGQDRHPALRRGLAAARRFPRLLRRLPRDRRRPAALQAVDDFLDAVDAQAARRPLAGLADPGAELGEPRARPRHLQRSLSDAHLDFAAVLDHRFVRRCGGDDGSAGGNGAGRGVDRRGARFPSRHAQGRRGMGR